MMHLWMIWLFSLPVLVLGIKTKVGVVGAGVGGLVVAGNLAMDEALDVTLIESNEVLGGRMNSESIETAHGSFRFDTGPSILLLPDVYRKTLENLGVKDKVELLKVEPFYRVYFEGEEDANIDLSSKEGAIEEMLIEWTGDKNVASAFQRYKRIADRFLAFGLPFVIEERSFSEVGLTKFVRFLAACLEAFPLLSHDAMIKGVFRLNNSGEGEEGGGDNSKAWTVAKRLRALFSFQDLYVGLPPQETPAVFSLLQALEYAGGIYYPRGGFTRVAQALEEAALTRGTTIMKGTAVTDVSVDPERRTVRSLHVVAADNEISSGRGSGKGWDIKQGNEGRGKKAKTRPGRKRRTKEDNGVLEIPVDVLVSNIDSPRFEASLLSRVIDTTSAATTAANKKRKGKKAEASKRLDFSESRPQKAGLSCSVVSLHLAFDVSLEAALAHHTLFLSPQIKSSWDNTKQGNTFKAADGVNFYVHAPSRTDATACPIGDFDAITVLVPIPPLATQNSGLKEDRPPRQPSTASIEKLVMRRLQACPGMPSDLADHVIAKRIVTAKDWQATYNLQGGSVFGLSHSLSQLSLLRPRLRHSIVRNVFRVGASVRPGNGVPLVMIGAKLTTEAVRRYLIACKRSLRGDEVESKPVAEAEVEATGDTK